MGAWGIGIFDNDDAADFLGEYEAGGVGAVIEAFEDVIASASAGYVDADVGAIGLAAAEIVGTSLGQPSDDLGEDERNVIRLHEADVAGSADARGLAPRTVDIVVTDDGTSELYDMWTESDSLAEWLGVVNGLRERLNGGTL
ncbi:DUF4259 domain-containing protein [Primorskyibacter flagellatus]|uniref:DUF4259 domain-containing protein n=1 Tax=Primorskyibacter flagellatus TaxID=1387277 RepID=UPI003A94961D